MANTGFDNILFGNMNISNDFNMEINMDDFSTVEIDIGNSFQSRYIKPPRSRERPEKYLKYTHAKKLSKDIVIEKESRYFIIINGSFIAGDFIEALVVKNNWHVKNMTVSTLSLSENNVDSFANLLNGKYLDNLNLIVSDYFFSHERHNLVPYIYKQLDNQERGNFQLAVAMTHCKTTNIETHCGLKIVIHGSANLRSSANIEQLMIEENDVLYDFNEEYQQNIIEKFKTIDKPVRSKNLWDSVKLK